MKLHCDYCGCPFRFQVTTMAPSLAPRPLWTKLFYASEPEKTALRAEVESYGHRTSWHLSYTCTGCGLIGTWGEELTQAEAEQWVTEKNTHLETPEARYAAEHWEDEVNRRIAEDSQSFARLFVERFPQWRDCLEPSQVSGVGLRVTIPSENPAISEPLGIEVKNAEVLIWWINGWHVHVYREDSEEPGSLAHLNQALDTLTDLVDEKIVTVASFVEGKPMGGSTIFAGQEIEWRWKIDRLQRRSWQGSYDRDIEKPGVTGNNWPLDEVVREDRITKDERKVSQTSPVSSE